METFYAEAVVIATGQLMADTGLTAGQIAQLRDAERAGKIRGLVVEADVDIASAFVAGIAL